MNNLLRFAIAAALILGAQTLRADETLKLVPNESTWFADGCETWNCAAAALVLANGDGTVVALPSPDAKFKWLVLRHVSSGSFFITPENPFQVDVVSSFAQGASMLATMDVRQAPMIITMGKIILLVTTRAPRERTASH
jgi:hypothetical protein